MADSVRAEWNRLYPEKVLFDQAYSLEHSGDEDQAFTMYHRVASMTPWYADAWSNMGGGYLKRGKYRDAVDCYDRALRLNPYERAAYNNLGTCYLYLGKYPESEEVLKKALELAPKSVEALCNLAGTYRLTGRSEEYLELIIRAGLQPKASIAVIQAASQACLNSGKFDDASELLLHALDMGLDTQTVLNLKSKYPQLLPGFRK